MRTSHAPVLMLAGWGLAAHAGGEALEVYGRVNVTLQNCDEASGEHVELRNNASRLGGKGGLELTPQLKAIYQLEFGVNIDGDGDIGGTGDRNSYVGIGVGHDF